VSIGLPGTEATAAGVDWTASARGDSRRALRTTGALVLAVLAVLPVWSLLAQPATGLAGVATADMARTYASFVWYGFALLLIPAILLSRTLATDVVARWGRAACRALVAWPVWRYAVLLSVLAFVVTAVFGLRVLSGQPNLVDAMAQLLHARFLAEGRLAGPADALGAFWHVQQSLLTPNGWVSQYPPGHIAVLAAGIRLNAAWAVGPLMLALTVLFTALSADRLLPARPVVARLGALLVALSPFLVAHAGAFMNHTTAAAFAAIALYCTLRARESARWSVPAGAALGAMFATRPLSGLTLGIVLVTWLLLDRTAPATRPGMRALTGLALGAFPFVFAVAAYNQHFFGSPFTFGYSAALGEASGLGWGLDPWGNTYGPVEMLAYTSAELTALSLFLLETPLPLVLLIALWLWRGPRLHSGERLLVAIAASPLLAQALYWHHGLFMGPRMLNESAPAWCLLAVLAGDWLVRVVPERAPLTRDYSPRVAVAVTLAGALAAGVLVFGPLRLASYRQRPLALDAAAVAAGPALVFVHGGWTSRLAMRLAASGMRLDSVETALRQNPTCAVEAYAAARATGRALPPLDLTPRAYPLPEAVNISPGNRIRILAGERLAGECARQAAADRLGTIDVTPLLWRGDLPGSESRGTMYVRDLGPETNAALIAAHPHRRPWVLLTASPESRPGLEEYDAAMDRLWGRTAGAD
jgi:4-amino-4-deoxy-L-arabinose transferase-like glycosyltransferase